MLTEPLDVFLDDFGVVCVYGAVVATVVLDAADRELFAGGAQTTDYLMQFVTASLPGLKYGDSVTVDGRAFTVQQVMAIDDGAFSTATLQA